jgi:N-acetylglutamate synthase-like GNAT family acetyltransferase
MERLGMNNPPKQIKDLTGARLEKSVAIIRSAFGKVAPELGITAGNAPLFPAFITLERLEEMRARGAVFYGYFIGGQQVGVVALEKRGRRGYFMERLAVLPEYWHSGIGRELVDYVIERARERRVKHLHLGMVNEHKVLKEWYESMGFSVTSVRKFAPLPFSVCFMEKDLR